MPNFETSEQSENVIHREDQIRDPLDFSSQLDPVSAAITIGNWVKAATGLGIPKQVPEDSMAGQAGYNAIGRGYEDGGEIDDNQPALPRTDEGQNTNETPSSMMDNGGATGTSGSQQSNIWTGAAGNPQAMADLKERAFGGLRKELSGGYANQQSDNTDTPKTLPGGVDYTQQIQNDKEYANPLSPTSLQSGLHSLAQQVVDYTHQLFAGNPQGLAQGANAMPHPVAEIVRASSNPDGTVHNEGEVALQKAFDKGGPDTASAFLANSVQAYGSARAFASVAYDKNNMASSLDAANKAFKYLPLPDQPTFTQGSNGNVIATVTGKGDKPPTSYVLSRESYRELIRGQTGFGYDVIMRGIEPVLEKLSKENHGLWAPPTSQGVKPSQMAGVVPETYKAQGVNQAAWNLATEMFPSVGQTQQKIMFLQGQIQTREKYAQELAVAQQQGLNRAQVAALTGAARQGVAETQVEGRKEVEGMRGETQRDVANTRGENYHERTIMQAKTANDKLLAQPGQEANKDRAAQRHIVLGQLMKGTVTQDEADAMLKKNGDSLKNLLGPYQQAPAQAPQVKGGQGAAQVAQSKGGSWTFPGGKPDPKKPNGGAIWTPNQ